MSDILINDKPISNWSLRAVARKNFQVLIFETHDDIANNFPFPFGEQIKIKFGGTTTYGRLKEWHGTKLYTVVVIQ